MPVSKIRECIDIGDTYFGAVSISVTHKLRNSAFSNNKVADLIRQNATFDLESLLSQPATSEIIERSVNDGGHYYPTKS